MTFSKREQIEQFQYNAIDDATRIRSLKIYDRHNQQNAIDFVDYVVDKFPSRIHTVQTNKGHEFQSKFHCRYIKPRTPKHNATVEHSHKTDKIGFYQPLTYKDDADLNAKLSE